MFKFAALILTAMIFVSFDASALVQQSASDALSFHNVVSNSASSSPSSLRLTNKKKALPEAPQQIDIRNGFSKNVTVPENGEFVVLLSEKKGNFWKISYDSDTLIMTGNSVNGNIREVKFMQKEKKNGTVFFDNIDSEGQVLQNKAVYVKGI